MSDTPNPIAAQGAAFDRSTSCLFLGALALAMAALLVLGPIEAMERLAAVLRHLLPGWGR